MTGNWPEVLENQYPLSLASMEKGLYHWLWLRAFLKKAETFLKFSPVRRAGRMEADSGGKPELGICGNRASGMAVDFEKTMAQGAEDSLLSIRERAEKEAPNLLENIDAFLSRIHLYQGKDVSDWLEIQLQMKRKNFIPWSVFAI